MNICVEKLKTYLASRPVRYGSDNICSLLGLLQYWYLEENPVDNEAIRSALAELDGITEQLTLADQNRMFMVTTELCQRYVEQAFEDGLHTGLRLSMELFT